MKLWQKEDMGHGRMQATLMNTERDLTLQY